jgi:mono/diheme cytochrome c family protein
MRRTVLSVLVLVGAAPLSVMLGAQALGGSAEGKKMKNPVAASAASIAAGKASYSKNCRFCHGTEAKGDGPAAPKGSKPSDLTDAQWTRGSTDGEIFLVIREGTPPKFEMKGFQGRMTDQEMWNVVNFIKSIGPKK